MSKCRRSCNRAVHPKRQLQEIRALLQSSESASNAAHRCVADGTEGQFTAAVPLRCRTWRRLEVKACRRSKHSAAQRLAGWLVCRRGQCRLSPSRQHRSAPTYHPPPPTSLVVLKQAAVFQAALRRWAQQVGHRGHKHQQGDRKAAGICDGGGSVESNKRGKGNAAQHNALASAPQRAALSSTHLATSRVSFSCWQAASKQEGCSAVARLASGRAAAPAASAAPACCAHPADCASSCRLLSPWVACRAHRSASAAGPRAASGGKQCLRRCTPLQPQFRPGKCC